MRKTRQGTPKDERFTIPLYTVRDGARYLGVPRQTLSYWASPQHGRPPIVTAFEGRRSEPVVPFVGLTEAFVASVFRRVHGLSMQYLRKSLTTIKDDLGLENALAWKRLYTDGARILFDHRSEDEEAMLLVEVVSRNVVFTDVIRDYLKRISYGPDGWATSFVLPTKQKLALVNPRRAYGQPLTIRGGVRVIDLLDRFEGGDDPADIGSDFDLPEDEVLEIVRAFYTATPEAA